MVVKAVGFDLGDTLFEYEAVPLSWEDEYPRALAAVADTCQCLLTPEGLQEAIAILMRYNTRRSPREEEVTAEYIFSEILRAWCVSNGGQWRTAAEAFFDIFRQRLRAFPDAHEVVLKSESEGVSIGVFTDVPYGMPREMVLRDIEAAGLALRGENVLTSVDVGRRKPNPLGILRLAEICGAAASQFVYVGNERKDVEAARAAGCVPVLVWRSSEEVPVWGQALTIRDLSSLFRDLSEVELNETAARHPSSDF